MLPSRGNVVSVMGNSDASMCSLAIFRLREQCEYACSVGVFSNAPPLHVRLYVQKVLEANAPWFPRGCFEHKASKLRVKDWCRICHASALISTIPLTSPILTYLVSPVCTSGTPPPSARSFSSVARAARISAWRRDNRTLWLFWS